MPASSSTAGIMAATDFNAAPWFSPAGPRTRTVCGYYMHWHIHLRKQKEIPFTKPASIRLPTFRGQGVLLFGDKTKLARPSAFDRINVRRLFLGLERAISL